MVYCALTEKSSGSLKPILKKPVRMLMKIGDLVKFHVQDQLGRWFSPGLVCEVCVKSFNVNILWPKEGLQLVDRRFLEVLSESR